jgi:ABC-type multidrug transport system fused ATPase/permease subunit
VGDLAAVGSAEAVTAALERARSADLIIVVDGGRVTEVGDHDQLMARGGLYADLFTLQAAAYR